MNNNQWISTSNIVPNNNRAVETKLDDFRGVQNIQKLRFYKGLWWFPDMSMYVYYTPTHWREIDY